MNPVNAKHPRPLAPAAVAVALLALAGCSSLDSAMSGEKVDYRSQAGKTAPLDVPPDLSQLAREGRYQPQSGVVVSANAMKQQPGSGSAAPSTVGVAPNQLGDLRIERQGNTRYLVTKIAPEQLYPLVRSFWIDRGFVLAQDSPEIGQMQTDWAENRSKLPSDFIRNTVGKVFERLYDTGERDLFRTRIERTAGGSEVFISHRGMEEVQVGLQNETTKWQPRKSDPALESEMLARLMLRLGGASNDAGARTAVAQAGEVPARARSAPASEGAVAMDLDESFDRAWRQVGLALDRGGFTVEDRDRSAGLYFVRYIDPKYANQEEPNFFAKLFSSDDPAKRLQRYRVVVKANGDKSRVSVQNADGVPEVGDAAKRIVGRLVDELR